MSSQAVPVETSMEPIALNLIKPSPSNPRKDLGDLGELVQSIKEHGVLAPVLVRPKGSVYELVFGHRRLAAAEKAGLAEVPAMIREMTDLQVLEAQLVENCQRRDIHPLEEAHGYQVLMTKAKYDVAKIADRVGRSARYVYDRVRLLDLTKDAQQLFRDGKIGYGHAVLLARLSPADQKRVIGDGGEEYGSSPLFTEERLLFREDDETEGEPMKAISVGELQAWIDKHVKLEAAQAEPMLFPETIDTLQRASELGEKVVRITYDDVTPDAVKDGPRPILGRSWKRADGKRGSKTCDDSVIGMLVIGPGRGETLRVCVAKKRCEVHWKEYQQQAKKRELAATKGGSSGEDRERIRRQKEQEENARHEAERLRWKKAEPAIVAAIATAVKKAPVGSGSPLGKYVLSFAGDNLYRSSSTEAAKHVAAGKSAEDLVRHISFWILLQDLEDFSRGEFATNVKATVGIDVGKILDSVAPSPKAEAPKPKAKASGPLARKSKAKK